MAEGAGDPISRLGKALGAGSLTARAKAAMATLKAEYEAGRRGDDSPPAVLWAPPRAQLEAFVGVLAGLRPKARMADAGTTTASDAPDTPATADASADPLAVDADEVSSLLGAVDWVAVRESASSRSADATRAVRSMAAQVDWDRVQPMARQASSLLIAAVASGQLPVAGRTGALVARAMLDQGGLGERVGRQVMQQTALRPELRTVIEVVDTIAAQRPAAPG
jgi:hypothetical protein